MNPFDKDKMKTKMMKDLLLDRVLTV